MASKKVQHSKTVSSFAYGVPASDLSKLHTLQIRYTDPTPERVLELAKDIAENGQLEPGVCRLNAANEPELLAGNTRLRAIQLINGSLSEFGLDEPLDFYYVLRDLPEGPDTILAALNSNSGEPVSLMDICKSIFDLHKLGWAAKEIEERMPKYLARGVFTINLPGVYLAIDIISKLPSDVKDKLASGNLKKTDAQALLQAAKSHSLTTDELNWLSDCVIGRNSFIEYLSRLKESDTATDKRIGELLPSITTLGLNDERISATTIKQWASGKKRTGSQASEPDRQASDLIKLLTVINTPESMLVCEWFKGGMEDEALVRVFRQLHEMNEEWQEGRAEDRKGGHNG